MDERYSRSLGAVTPEELAALKAGRVLIAGCGGLGGWLSELLCRSGVGDLVCADGDVFELSNLNRQHLCEEALLGVSKARAAADRVAAIDPSCTAEAVCEFITDENRARLVSGCAVALDALDTAGDRLALADECSRQGVPLVHGAIDGWSAQICVVTPGSGILRRLYSDAEPASSPSLAYAAALCASIQAAETVKLLCGRRSALENRLLCVDLRTMSFDIITP